MNTLFNTSIVMQEFTDCAAILKRQKLFRAKQRGSHDFEHFLHNVSEERHSNLHDTFLFKFEL